MEDSVIHIVKRTDQWNERAMFNYLVPRGVFCVELTPDNKTKLKVGEGNKYYRQLPYIGNDIDISDYFTKEEVEKLVKDKSEETVIKYMDKQPYMRVIGPPLPSPSALPKSGNKEGDVRFVKLAKVQEGNAYTEYVWFEGRWEPISAALDIDLSKYATKEELAAVQKTATELARRLTLVEQAKHVHMNKGVLDLITAPFTTELASKLSGIEPNANRYVLPIATRHSLGGIIIGDGLLIDSNGRVTIDTSGIIIPPYDDTELRQRIGTLERSSHKHSNKTILDNTTASYTISEKEKLAGLENYDDTEIRQDISDLQDQAHTHANKSILDQTTAPYTTEEQTKLAGLENYTLPVASANTLGGIKVGANLSIDQDGVLSATGGGTEYLAGEGISITERSEESNTPVDISSEHWVNESPTSGGSRYTISTNQTYLLQRYSLAAGTSFRVKFVPTNPTDIIYYGFDSYPSNSDNGGGITIIGQTGPVNGFEIDQSRIYTMPADRNSLDISIRINDTYWTSSDVASAASFTELKLIITESATQGTFIDANVRDGLTIDSSDNTINVTPATNQTIGGVIIGNGVNVAADGTISVTPYTLPTASDSTLGGVKVGTGLSIDQDGVLSADGGSGKEYDAGDGIRIDQGSGGNGFITTDPSYIDDTNVCMMVGIRAFQKITTDPAYGFAYTNQNDMWKGPLFISTIEAGVEHRCSGFSDIMSWFSFDYMNKTWYVSTPSYWDTATCSTTLPDIDFTGYNVTSQSDVEIVFKAKLDEIYANPPLVNDTINVIPATTQTIGGVIIGNGINVDQNGVISVDTPTEYVAGDGISIDAGEATRDLTILTWEQGTIDTNGADDNTATYAIRSPFIQNGLTDRISVFAQTTGEQTMYWKLFYYDSNHNYYAQTSDWATSPTLKVTPNVGKCKYIKIVLVINVSTAITPSILGTCELSYPFEVGKDVITNTGVTHIEMNGQNEINVVENGDTSTLMKFGSDFEVTNGVVNIPDYHRLILNVEE